MLSKRHKAKDLASQQFYKLDKWILAESKLKKLSPTAKLLYVVLRDREELSLRNAKDFTDKEGYIFQYFDQEKASELLGISLSATKKAFKDLTEYNLIESVRQGLGKPNRLYILDYEVSEDTMKELAYENKKVDTLPQAPTKESKNNKPNNSIYQNDKKNSKKYMGNKNKFNNFDQNFLDEFEDETDFDTLVTSNKRA
ncbi:replication initiator protein A [Romboutsia sp.]|uniref:replication initiator protein A n=1 Tax=Romboutsia sp. TaxID=1965302 RepID=UPI002C37346C|nr:replication initiator protein A [Romboutsia sp.]HSQ89179.1 replication initiator protein A [Romboutsia sp.]